MASVKSALKRVCIPLGVIAGVGIALSWYYFGWVASRGDYFRKRDFRQLATLSGQIQKKVDNFDNIMDHSWDSIKDKTSEQRAKYFTNVGSDLEYQDKDDLPQNVRDMKPNDPPSLAIERDEGDYFLFFALEPPSELEKRGHSGSSQKPKALYIRSNVGGLVSPFAVPLRSSFEVILVARRDGTVIFQQPSGNGVINLRGLERAAGGEGTIDVGALCKAPMSSEVKLAAAKYTLYSQPIRLSYPSVKSRTNPLEEVPAAQSEPSEGKKTEGTKTESRKTEGKKTTGTPATPEGGTELEEWIVCGLVQSERFDRDSLAISSTAVLGFVVALLFVFCLTPFIKLSLLRAQERLRARDGVLMVVCTFLGTALITFVALDAYYYGFQFHDEQDEQLRRVAQSMQDNLNKEEEAIWNQLERFDTTMKDSPLANDLGAIRTCHRQHGEGQGLYLDQNADLTPTWDCHQQRIDGQDLYVSERTNILRPPAEGSQDAEGFPRAVVYPYLNLVFWDDNEGLQRIKWTYQKQVTPFLSENDMPYFPDIRKEASWLEKDFDVFLNGHPEIACQLKQNPSLDNKEEFLESHPALREYKENVRRARGINSVYSVNSGKNIAIYWRLEELDSKNKLGGGGSSSSDSRLLSASLVTRPLSLLGPVLPTDYQFAVVNKDGWVLFHSDPTKNLIENFVAECDDNQELGSLVSERASGSLYAYYAGRRQHLYVCPLRHNRPAASTVHNTNGLPGLHAAVFPDAGPAALKGDSLWSLAVFEDMLPAETMNSEALTSSSILFLLYAGILALAWALIHACWRRYPSKWFWPNEKKAAVYRLVALVNGFVSALLWVCVLRASSGTVVLAGFSIPAFALTLTFLVMNYEGGEPAGGQRPSVGEEDRNAGGRKASPCGSFALAWQRLLGLLNCTERPRWEASHAGALVSLLVVVAVLPCIAFFRVTYDFEKMLLINRGHHRLIKSLLERQERVRSEYQSIALSEDNEKKVLAGPIENPRRQEQVRSVFQSIALSEGSEKTVLADPNENPQAQTFWLALGSPDEPAAAGQTGSTLASVEDPPPQGGASEQCFGEGLQWLLTAVRPQYNEIAGEAEGLISETTRSGSGSASGSLHRVANSTEMTAPPNEPADEAGAEHWDCSLVSDPGTPRLALTRDTQDLNGGPLYLRAQWEPSRLGWGDWRGWFGLAALVAVVFLFVRLAGSKIFYTAIPVRRDLHVPRAGEDQEFSEAVAEFKRKVSAANEKARQEIAGFFREECSPRPELRAIGKEFVSYLRDNAEITQEEIVLEVHDRAGAYYRMLWETLSKDEKRLLAQLAHEGLVNPKNPVLTAQLMRKGLMVRDRPFRLMNRSFTRFVISALPPNTMNEWETEGVSLPWNTLRWGLLAAVASLGIFLYVTQQSLFESVAAYVGAIVAAIPALIRLVGIFQGAPAGGAHAE